jgi:hypothetical protein
VFTVGRCLSLGYISEQSSVEGSTERNSSSGNTRESELELEATVTVSDSSELSVGDSHGKFVFEEELTCGLKTLCLL